MGAEGGKDGELLEGLPCPAACGMGIRADLAASTFNEFYFIFYLFLKNIFY